MFEVLPAFTLNEGYNKLFYCYGRAVKLAVVLVGRFESFVDANSVTSARRDLEFSSQTKCKQSTVVVLASAI